MTTDAAHAMTTRTGERHEVAAVAFKRRLYLVYLVAALLVSGLLVALPAVRPPGSGWSVANVALPLTLLFAAACIVALRRNPPNVVAVERAAYWLSYPLGLGALAFMLSRADGVAGQVAALHAFAPWAPVVAALGFLTFGSGRGLVGTMAFLASSGLVVGGFAVAAGEGALGVAFLAQLAAPLTVFVMVLMGFTLLLERRVAARASEEALASLASRDALTGLPNRAALESRSEEAREAVQRSGRLLAVCFVNVDDFRHVNDAYGHAGGDALLQQFAQRLRATAREFDTVARISGAEFVVLAFVKDVGQANALAETLATVRSAPFELDGREVRLGATVGLSVYPRGGPEAEALLTRDDASAYEARIAGGGGRATASRAPTPPPSDTARH